MLEAYRHHVAERAALGIPPLPLSAQQTADVIELLKNPPAGEAERLEQPGEAGGPLVELGVGDHLSPVGHDDGRMVRCGLGVLPRVHARTVVIRSGTPGTVPLSPAA